MDDIHNRFHHLFDSLDLVWLDPEVFAQVIHDKGAPLNDCWGFVDGTPRPIARPIRNQRIMFSGHKRIHLKFQVLCKAYSYILVMPKAIFMPFYTNPSLLISLPLFNANLGDPRGAHQ